MQGYLEDVCLPDQNANRLFRHLGVCLRKAENGEAVLAMPVALCFAQGIGLVAGGILATLADEAMAHAVMTATPHNAVTVEMNVRYLRATRADAKDEELVAEARVLKAGGTIITAAAEVKNRKGDVLATAGASFCVIKEQGPRD